MKKFIAILMLAVLCCLCLVSCGGNKTTDGNVTDSNVTSGDVKQAAFEKFESKDFNGNTVTEKIFEGNKLTIVNIWGTFCQPCIGEMPDFEKISKEYAEKGVRFIGICADINVAEDGSLNEEKISKARDIMKETGVTYTNILPSKSLNEVKLNSIEAYPTTIFVDEDGNVLDTFVGSNSYDVWCTRIDSFIK